MKCFLYGLYINIRYANIFLFKGYWASGHDWDYTGKTHEDHWLLECKDCKKTAGTDIGPESVKSIIDDCK